MADSFINKEFSLQIEHGAVLYTIVNNEYLFLAVRNEDSSYSFFRRTCDTDMTVPELEKAIHDELGIDASIDKWFSGSTVEYSDAHTCTYYTGRFEADDHDSSKYQLFNYLQMKDALNDPKDIELLELKNWGLVIQKSVQHKPGFSFDYKHLPYIPLDDEMDKAIREYIKEYENSNLYDDIYTCAKALCYLYRNTNHIEDPFHNDKKYLGQLMFQICMWYPTYLDWMESPRNPKNK